MSLTLPHGPLSAAPSAVNYRLDGPPHRLFFDDFPRRVRAVLAGETVLDTDRGKLLHETGLLPQLYVPRPDVRFRLLEGSDHRTHCPFKGEALYWSVRVGDRTVEKAAWAYPQPLESAAWLQDYVAFSWDSMDAWFDEDENVQGHLRDPYHRVDVRDTSRHVRVSANGAIVADSRRSKVLSETGLPNRFYIPLVDVQRELLQSSPTESVCPYKGLAGYKSIAIGDYSIRDAAWFYPDPLEAASKVRNYLSFQGDGVLLEIDGQLSTFEVAT